jgi:hypothetical protein
MSDNFFPLRIKIEPKIYAYEDNSPQYKGLLKIGYTSRTVQQRVAEQYPIKRPGELPYKIVLEESAMKNDGGCFTDKDVHRYLTKLGISNPSGEWFRCTVKDIKVAIINLKLGEFSNLGAGSTFSMRPEQLAAVNKTYNYFNSFTSDDSTKIPKFLWNAKMRFGKTFAAYQLAKKMNWTRILVLTFKPAVENAWEEDLNHIDFYKWQFVSKNTLNIIDADKKNPIVCFGSFQDFLGKNKAGGIKLKNEWAHTINWDCVILDEYHYGAWRSSAKELFEAEDQSEIISSVGEGLEYFDDEILPITSRSFLYLSGTPFKALESGEFIEEQIFNWTYSDEQSAKKEWTGPNNPYKSLPRMVLMTYQLPDNIRQVALSGEYDEFDLNVFFSAKGEGNKAEFIYINEVQKWLSLIRGSNLDTIKNDLRLGAEKPIMPFSNKNLLETLTHTFWFLPTVSSCYAMKNLLKQKQNIFYNDYKIIVAAGTSAGIGVEALKPVLISMDNPLLTKTITLSCGKLTTGVSVKPWSGIFILRNTSSPETYFQAAFRVQTPWTLFNPDNISPNKYEILKEECYVFDFAPDRALQQIANYSCRLNLNESNPELKVQDFINFLPVLAYDGSSMKQINAAGILDIALSGTSATLLARRWESALLVNVDNATLERLMKNPQAMKALMNIEGFRSLSHDIQTIINKSDSVKKLKKLANEKELDKKEKKQLTDAEKEYKSKRKIIQDKLIKFAARIPIFMYLTDFRELSLKDVITKVEPGLFVKVTGLSISDFDLLVSLNVFNSSLMNDAVYKFKRYEDASLEYAGINKHITENKIGLFDTVIFKNN